MQISLRGAIFNFFFILSCEAVKLVYYNHVWTKEYETSTFNESVNTRLDDLVENGQLC